MSTFPNNDSNDKVSSPNTIDAMIQAEIQTLIQAEEISLQLYRVLDLQVEEVRKIGEQVKINKKLAKHFRNSYAKQNWWWKNMVNEIKDHSEALKGRIEYLKQIQIKCMEDLENFRKLQMDINKAEPH